MSQDAASTALSMARGGVKKIKVHKGPIHSSVAGRTDHLPMHVASGSYVIPADIISAMGEGNSMAGFKVAKSIFSVKGAYDQGEGMPYGGGEMPYGQPVPHKAGGGGADMGRSGSQMASRDRQDSYARASQPSRPAAPAPSPSPARAPAGPTPSRAPAAPAEYNGIWDRINGGGPGAGYKNAWDMINGGGMGAGYKNPLDMINGGGMNASRSDGSGGTGSMGLPNPFPNKPNYGGVIGGLVGGPVGYLAGSMLTGRATGPADFINGGGLGASADTFKGGPTSGAMNMLGVTPYSSGMSTGGHVHDGDAVPIVAAGGEYVIPPEDVEHIGQGSLEDGHKILDAFVKKMRKKAIRTLQSLPGPKKD